MKNTFTHSREPFISVLICSLNGGKRIGDCLDSLNGQTYGRENFEIIVVDDGSSDDTGIIAKSYSVQVIRNEINKGIPSARNAALSAARGEIVVFIDDDCVADTQWLSSLVATFEDKSVVAVGGRILALSTKTIAQRYLQATAYGNPARLLSGGKSSIFQRLMGYINTMISPILFENLPVEVSAVYTANAAYRRDVLLRLGGFDETLLTNEDSDVSERLRKIVGSRIMYIPMAIVRHQHYEKISKVIYQPYRRAINTLQFYLKDKRIPPLFPMPVLYVVFVIVLSLAHDILLLSAGIILTPLLLYGWWIIRALREKNIEYLFYPYIQILVEGGVLLGFIKGWFSMLFRPMSI